jgi:hypothetical protein
MPDAASEKTPCFLYREGVHFTLPPGLTSQCPVPNPCAFVLRLPEGGLIPNPEAFYEVSDPEAAFFFLFPYDIGQYIDSCNLELTEQLIAGLPYLRGREARHIVCDYGDKTLCVTTGVCLFKISLLREHQHLAVPMWYDPPAHTRSERPSFDWSAIRYAVSFVGEESHIFRRAMIVSIKRQAPELKAFFQIRKDIKFVGNYFFKPPKSEDTVRQEQRTFLDSIRKSFSVLCPPGFGPQSVRLYETMLLGRIPVIFGERTAYPLEGSPRENLIDYDSFCLRIPEKEILDTGTVLKNFFEQTPEKELRERCILACRTWNNKFAKHKLRTLLGEAKRKFAL